MPANRHFRPLLTPSPGAAARGFTLIELLVVLTISAILLAVGVPMFQTSIANMRATDAANSLVASIDLARAEAIRRGDVVRLCRITAGSDTACAAAGDWATGWVVWTDAPNTAPSVDAANEIDDNDRIQLPQPLGAGGGAVVAITGSVGTLAFGPNGVVTPAAATFNIVYPAGAEASNALARRCVALAGVGSVTTTRAACP